MPPDSHIDLAGHVELRLDTEAPPSRLVEVLARLLRRLRDNEAARNAAQPESIGNVSSCSDYRATDCSGVGDR